MDHQFENPGFVKAFSYLRGQTIRWGGITADALAYTVDAAVSPGCPYATHKAFTSTWPCKFSTGRFKKMLMFFKDAGVELMFDLNELTGRNCSQKGLKPWQPDEWCGDKPLVWDTKPLRAFLEAIRDEGLVSEGIMGFELGNELFRPPHLSHETAAEVKKTKGTQF